MLHSLPTGPVSQLMAQFSAQASAQFSALVTPALAERLTLLLNHVLAAEPAATQRLAPHAGAVLALSLEQWPALLPTPPRLVWRITPAGLLQWSADEASTADTAGAPARLAVAVDAANPALLLADAMAGKTPAVRIDGDAQLAGEVAWLIDNLRWDVAADLERLFGPTVAGPLHQTGKALARGLSAALAQLAELGGRAAGAAGAFAGRRS